MDIIKADKLYQFKTDFLIEAPPLKWFGKRGEIVRLEGKSWGYNHFHTIEDNRLILMTKKEAFEYLEIVES